MKIETELIDILDSKFAGALEDVGKLNETIVQFNNAIIVTTDLTELINLTSSFKTKFK